MMGFDIGDAHVIWSCGGRATDDATRSLIISYKLLGTKEWFVIHHVNCEMQKFTNDVMSCLLDHRTYSIIASPKYFWNLN